MCKRRYDESYGFVIQLRVFVISLGGFVNNTLSSKLIFLGMLVLLALLDVADGVSFFADVDDRMRDFQIRDLLADGQWYDLSLPFIQMPEAYVSPWSRLVDFPYVAIAVFLGLMMDGERALWLAYQIWPLVLLIPFALFVHGIIQRSLNGRPNFIELFATALLMVYAVWEFVPGRIDHHNVQLTLVAAIGYGLVRWDRTGAVVLGLASVVSIHVGLETLPIIVVAFAGIALIWAGNLKPDDGGNFLVSAAFSVIVGAVVLTTIQPGWGRAVNVACDAFSAPYIAGSLLAGFCLLGAVKLGALIHSPIGRLALLGALGILIAGVLALLFPLCLEGPYHMIDMVSRNYWLDTLSQERGILSIIGEKQQSSFASVLVVLLFAPGFVILALHRFRSGEPAWMVLCFMAMVSIALTFFQMRFYQFMVLLVPLCVPWCIRYLVVAKIWGRSDAGQISPLAQNFAMGLPLLIAVGGIGWYVIQPSVQLETTYERDGVRYLHYDVCESFGPNLAYLESIAPGRIIAGDGASVAIAGILTRNRLDHSIAALAFHRASHGIRQIAIAFTSKDKAERDEILHEFDYVAICGVPAEILKQVDMSGTPLFGVLSTVKSSEGFELMPPSAGTRLRIFKIVAPIR